MKIERFVKYKCRVNLRKLYRGRKIKPEALNIDGVILTLQVVWLQDDDDKYPNEWAMYESVKALPLIWGLTKGQVAWISSGDVSILGLVET